MSVHECFLQLDPCLIADRHHFGCLKRGHGQRLLTQDVLSRLGSLDHPLCVHVVREGYVDRIHVLSSQKLLVPTVCFRDCEFQRSGRCAIFIARSDSHYFTIRCSLNRRRHLRHAYVRCTQDAPTQLRHVNLRVHTLPESRVQGDASPIPDSSSWEEGRNIFRDEVKAGSFEDLICQ